MTTMVYKIGGPHRAAKGLTYSFLGTEGKCPVGWHSTLEGAVKEHLAPKSKKPKAAYSKPVTEKVQPNELD